MTTCSLVQMYHPVEEQPAASICSVEYKKVGDYELLYDKVRTERRRATQAVHLCGGDWIRDS